MNSVGGGPLGGAYTFSLGWKGRGLPIPAWRGCPAGPCRRLSPCGGLYSPLGKTRVALVLPGILLASGRPGVEAQLRGGFLSGSPLALPPAFAEATEILPTSFRALVTLSRQSLYLYEFVLKNPQTTHRGDLSYRLRLLLPDPPGP